ncbi:hypothetical protein RHMOL_Rhmol06G0147200 [Rhododendron molle]|uniref:Uncharacterized protein n=1 Tax=Rhododendron molle TaxID=49168 RepID=A0ACC0NDN2_RHOML|nr:hypothetical protein RHMOL_Rhmol06G0147200 [Rhododendron molle]
MLSQNQSKSHQNFDGRLYDCGIPARLTTSCTPTNSGRRFLHCMKFGVHMSFSTCVHDFFDAMELLNGFDIIKTVDTRIAEEDDIVGGESIHYLVLTNNEEQKTEEKPLSSNCPTIWEGKFFSAKRVPRGAHSAIRAVHFIF